MTPTDLLRRKIRRMINETIPADGTAADTNFSEVDIDDILTENSDLNSAAAGAWMQKAALLNEKIQQYTIGQESYTMTSLKDMADHCLKMAAMYTSLAEKTGANVSSLALNVVRPGVV